jgi:predicted metal-dependent phosphoesterase TrpH
MHDKLNKNESYIDLHIHSTYSDGLFSPAKILEVAQERGLKAISITDHDTVAATLKTAEMATEYDIEVVPGIEIGVAHAGCEVHLLGYFIDHNSPALDEYAELLKESREERARTICRVLRQQGVHITYEMVEQKANGSPIGRPHIAQVLLEEGYVFSNYEAFDKYLGEKKSGDVPKFNIGLKRAVSMIKEAGGLVFLAHPATIECCEEVLGLLIRYGLDGIESIHPKHTLEQRRHYGYLAEHHKLLQSGGSDCHGGRHGNITLGTLPVPLLFLDAMKNRLPDSHPNKNPKR